MRKTGFRQKSSQASDYDVDTQGENSRILDTKLSIT